MIHGSIVKGIYLAMLGGMLISVTFTLPTFAHEIPDGRVEVGLDVVVKNEEILITYQLALNDQTMLELHPDLENSTDGSGNTAELDLVYRFGPRVLGPLASKLIVTVDNQRFPVEPVEWEPAPRHPIRLVCKYRVELGSHQQEAADVKIEDQNFREYQKQIAMAIRTSKGPKLESSNSALLLVRAERNRLWELDQTEQASFETITAEVKFIPRFSPKADPSVVDNPTNGLVFVGVIAILLAVTSYLLLKLRKLLA